MEAFKLLMFSISFVWLAFLAIVASGDISTTTSSALLSTADGTFCDGDGWVVYRDEKCYKLIKQWKSRDEAKDVCAQEGLQSDGSQLATIKSVDEQSFLTEFVFGASAVTINVWFGATRQPENGSNFIWDDGSDVVEFTNWAEDCPSDKIQQGCVALKSEYVKASKPNSQGTAGEWRDVPCEMPNYVLCEKLPGWSLSKLQQTLMETRKKLKESNKLLFQELDDTKSLLARTVNELDITKNQLDGAFEETKDKLIPIGFLYTQLPHEKAPSEIWPWMSWQDVSSTYAGLFFRVSGGEAASFGEVQVENCPRITHYVAYCDGGVFPMTGSNTSVNQISNTFRSENYYMNGIAFDQALGEVRPRNMAIQFWKRTQ